MIVYEQGRAAFYNGLTLDDNPYITVGWADWAFGWTEAQGEAKDKKMTERKYHKGDKVTVEGTIIGDSSMLIIDVNGSHVNIDESKILSHTPAPIKVGDSVECYQHSGQIFEVLAIIQNYVWIKGKDRSPFTVDIRELSRIEDTVDSQSEMNVRKLKLSRLIEDR